MRSSLTIDTLAVEHLGFGADAVEYQAGWDLQRRVHVDVVDVDHGGKITWHGPG